MKFEWRFRGANVEDDDLNVAEAIADPDESMSLVVDGLRRRTATGGEPRPGGDATSPWRRGVPSTFGRVLALATPQTSRHGPRCACSS